MESVLKNLRTQIVVVGIGLFFAKPVAALTLDSHLRIQESYVAESQGKKALAIERMIQIYKGEPNDYFVNLRLGWLFYSNGKYKNAEDHYSRAAGITPTSVEPLLGLSLTLVTEENWTQVLQTCEELLKRDPNNYLGQQRKIQAYLKLNRFSEAAQTASEVLKMYPTDAVFLEQRGYALQQQEKTEEARSVLTFLLAISPKNEYARSILGK